MTIKRVIDGKEIEIKLTENELLEAVREHFAKQNEEFIRSFVDEDEEFSCWSEEEKADMIRDIALQMVDHIQIEGDDAEVFWELAEEYRDKSFDDDEDYGDDEDDEECCGDKEDDEDVETRIKNIMKDCLETRGYEVTDEQLDELYTIYEDCQEWDIDIMLTGKSYDEVEDFVKHSSAVVEIFHEPTDD